ncbi:MAG: hypothetical protein C5B52_05000 [Bacteroidetes bacterium]|nr:MAG: hypothetical protein C5B52_05000 [Bacteroidota bacterium]
MKKYSLVFLFVSLAAAAICQSKEITIPGSQKRVFTSDIVKGQEYVLQIGLPAGYDKSNKKYPVVYLMDSQWDFPLVTALYGQQYFDGFIPELIIVGITWGGSNPKPDSLRVRDYTPTRDIRTPQSGGADNFLAVLKKEVFPLIEANYRVDSSDRTLMGCSLGGLFTIYSLFTHPEMFNRFVAASPAFMWDNQALNKYEEQYFAGRPTKPAKLFMCVGGVETSAPAFEKLASFIGGRNYSNLQIESRVLENTGHSGTKGEGFARGLQFIFKRPSLKLSASILEKYSGSYKLNGGMIVNMKVEHDSLTASAGNFTIKLLAASETDFYATSSFLKIHFLFDNKGNVSGFQLNQYGSSESAEKVK